MRRVIGFASAAVIGAAAAAPLVTATTGSRLVPPLEVSLSAATTCENLKSVSLPNTTITSAETVAAGAFTPPPANGRAGAAGRGRGPAANPYAEVPAFCRVTATLKPSADSDIKMELWMPTAGWNGKYQTAGNGGYAGNVGQQGLAAGVRRGYAIAATDTGHTGGAENMYGHPEKIVDFAYRALHETTVQSKALVAAFYGSGPKYSYFSSCSTGGRQALMEASKFPDDFNGIVAGDPAIYTSHQAAQQLWVGMAVHKDEASFIPAAKFPAIHKGAVAACDALDGVKDGVIENPRRCRFDPQALLCKNGDSNDCLTQPQVDAARKLYTAPVNPRTKQDVFPPLEPGSELGWGGMAGQNPFGYANDFYRFFVKKNPAWDYKTLDFDKDVAAAEKEWEGTFDFYHSNLKPFFARGGKLLQYHGWADPLITPGVSIDYYKLATKNSGFKSQQEIDDHLRLFMVPGMGHCAGGEGPSTVDWLKPMEEWIEQGKAPTTITASKVEMGETVRTRPLCMYPKEAVYKGSGSTDDAANFECRVR
jgi:feruloyl esterase